MILHDTCFVDKQTGRKGRVTYTVYDVNEGPVLITQRKSFASGEASSIRKGKKNPLEAL